MPSSWIVLWAGLVPAGTAILDVAAGSGRHTRFFAGRGHSVTAIDRATLLNIDGHRVTRSAFTG